MAQAAIPLMIAGALVKGVGGLQAGYANAKILNQQATETMVLGNAESLKVRSEARRAMGRQVARQAESGAGVGSGSALTALEESMTQRELDIMTIRRNASGKAAGLRAQGKQAITSAWWGAAGEAIGAASMISNYKADMGAARESVGG